MDEKWMVGKARKGRFRKKSTAQTTRPKVDGPNIKNVSGSKLTFVSWWKSLLLELYYFTSWSSSIPISSLMISLSLCIWWNDQTSEDEFGLYLILYINWSLTVVKLKIEVNLFETLIEVKLGQ